MFYRKKSFYIVLFLFGISVFSLIAVYAMSGFETDTHIPESTDQIQIQETDIETQAEVEYYDKTVYESEIASYTDVILPLNSKDAAYIDETVFVGDSNTEGLGAFGHLYTNNVLGKHSMDIQGVTSNAYIQIAEDNPETEEDESQYITMVQALANKQPKRIIINFGTNNAGVHAVADSFKATYTDTLAQIQAVCPNTQIVVAAVLPVARERDYPKIKQDKIDEFNISLAQLCRENGYGFLHYPEVFKDSETGYMSADYVSADGVHLNGDGYRLLLDYAGKHQYN
ncbi:MAG: hypothetical protein E7483_05820 [Ruminococcaceae bacterium]|nr:hypothetical protein [Oscillospiraceae bacterium]